MLPILSRQRYPSWTSVAILASIMSSAYAVGFSCSEVMHEGVHWDFKKLGGVHLAHHEIVEDPLIANWTFAIDLCQAIKAGKDVQDGTQCPTGTNICGIKREHAEGKTDDTVHAIVPISGYFSATTGTHMEVIPTRLKTSPSSGDVGKEGVRLEMSGGRFPFKKEKDSIPQKAYIELLCDREKSGWEPGKEPGSESDRIDNKEAEDKPKEPETTSAIKILSYGNEVGGKNDATYGVLRLEWRTKYACEDAVSTLPSDDNKASWGFFTWFIIILFLAISAYLIFGSWLNYTRYGARGLDLLPHSDTIRDIPYIIKDMFRRVQDGGSRGGYSAV